MNISAFFSSDMGKAWESSLKDMDLGHFIWFNKDLIKTFKSYQFRYMRENIPKSCYQGWDGMS